MGLIMGSQNIMGSDYRRNISKLKTVTTYETKVYFKMAFIIGFEMVFYYSWSFWIVQRQQDTNAI
jgi:hypothetical protein